MSTSHQRSGVRRPFGSVNANTLRASLEKTSGAASVHQEAIKPGAKVENKRSSLLSRRGLFTSILATAKNAGKKDRSGVDETLNLESPTKKARVNPEKELPATQPASPVLPSDCESIFRPKTHVEEDANSFWSDEMEELLTLKPSNNINESRDEDEAALSDDVEERDGFDSHEQVRSTLVKELNVDNSSSTEHTISLCNGRLKEDETDGIKIEFRE